MGEKKHNLNFIAPVPWGLKGGAKAININAIFEKILLLDIKQSNCWRDCNKHWAPYQNSEIHGPSVRGSGARVGLNDYIVKMH